MELKRVVELRAEAVTKMKDLVAGAEKEDRGLSADERTSWDKMEADITSYDDRIETIKRSNTLVAKLDEVVEDGLRGKKIPDEIKSDGLPEDRSDAPTHEQAFESYMRSTDGGLSGLSPEHRALMQDNRFALTVAEQRAQATTPGSAGGFLTPKGFGGQIIESMKRYGGIANRATILNTSTGNPLPFPGNDDTGNEGEIIAENAASNEQDLVFTEITLGAFKYSSKIIRISIELLQDSFFNLDAYVAGKFGERLGRITSRHYATGVGTTQPVGLATASSLGKTATSATAITYLELLDLKHSVDPSYRMGANWTFNDSTFLAVKKLLDTTGLPIWSPSVSVEAPSLLDGDPYVIDQAITSIASGNISVLYGDHSKYFIRNVMGFSMLRLVERYAEFGQVGFLAFMRSDANLMDNQAVKHLVQA